MSSQKPLLVVCGATGNQGGSVITHFLSQRDNPYAIRGITRDPSSANSVSLASKGVEMVAGNFGDSHSLDAAFQGASVIFGTTDFWVYFDDPVRREMAKATGQSIGILSRDNDAQQNKNIIDAAARVSTLERLVLSSMANTKSLSEGKYHRCHHFDGKALAEEYGKKTHPKLWEKTSVIYVGLYLENYLGFAGSLLRPKLNSKNNTLVLSLEEPLVSTLFPMVSVVDDTGALVGAVLGAPRTNTVIGVNEWLSPRQVALILGEVMRKEVQFVDKNPTIDFGDPERTEDHLDMLGFCIEFGYDEGKVDPNIVQPAELNGSLSLVTVKEWCEKQDWSKVLEVVE